MKKLNINHSIIMLFLLNGIVLSTHTEQRHPRPDSRGDSSGLERALAWTSTTHQIHAVVPILPRLMSDMEWLKSQLNEFANNLKFTDIDDFLGGVSSEHINLEQLQKMKEKLESVESGSHRIGVPDRTRLIAAALKHIETAIEDKKKSPAIPRSPGTPTATGGAPSLETSPGAPEITSPATRPVSARSEPAAAARSDSEATISPSTSPRSLSEEMEPAEGRSSSTGESKVKLTETDKKSINSILKKNGYDPNTTYSYASTSAIYEPSNEYIRRIINSYFDSEETQRHFYSWLGTSQQKERIERCLVNLPLKIAIRSRGRDGTVKRGGSSSESGRSSFKSARSQGSYSLTVPGEVEALKGQVEHYKAKAEEADTQLAIMREEIFKLTTAEFLITEHKAKAAELGAKAELLEAKQADLEADMQNMHAEKMALERKVKLLQEMISTLEDILAQTGEERVTELEASRKEREETIAKMGDVAEKLRLLQASLGQKTTELAEAQGQLAESRRQYVQLQAEKADLEKKLSEAQAQERDARAAEIEERLLQRIRILEAQGELDQEAQVEADQRSVQQNIAAKRRLEESREQERLLAEQASVDAETAKDLRAEIKRLISMQQQAAQVAPTLGDRAEEEKIRREIAEGERHLREFQLRAARDEGAAEARAEIERLREQEKLLAEQFSSDAEATEKLRSALNRGSEQAELLKDQLASSYDENKKLREMLAKKQREKEEVETRLGVLEIRLQPYATYATEMGDLMESFLGQAQELGAERAAFGENRERVEELQTRIAELEKLAEAPTKQEIGVQTEAQSADAQAILSKAFRRGKEAATRKFQSIFRRSKPKKSFAHKKVQLQTEESRGRSQDVKTITSSARRAAPAAPVVPEAMPQPTIAPTTSMAIVPYAGPWAPQAPSESFKLTANGHEILRRLEAQRAESARAAASLSNPVDKPFVMPQRPLALTDIKPVAPSPESKEKLKAGALVRSGFVPSTMPMFVSRAPEAQAVTLPPPVVQTPAEPEVVRQSAIERAVRTIQRYARGFLGTITGRPDAAELEFERSAEELIAAGILPPAIPPVVEPVRPAPMARSLSAPAMSASAAPSRARRRSAPAAMVAPVIARAVPHLVAPAPVAPAPSGSLSTAIPLVSAEHATAPGVVIHDGIKSPRTQAEKDFAEPKSPRTPPKPQPNPGPSYTDITADTFGTDKPSSSSSSSLIIIRRS